jgi:hypothetical protein
MRSTITNNFVFLILGVVLFFSSCRCNERDESAGKILADLKIENYYYEGGTDCMHIVDTFCIRTDSAYHAFFQRDTAEYSCQNLIFPYVDFNSASVLGYRISGGNVRFHRSVLVDSTNKVVTYFIETVKCPCADKCIRGDMNMVLVPKIADDYTVKFR